MLRIVLTQPRVVNRGVEVEATYTGFLVSAKIQRNCTLGLKGAVFHTGPEALQTDPAFSGILQDVMIFCEAVSIG